MNAHNGQWHLKRLVMRYSETAGSSVGVRFYLRHLLPVFKAQNPQIDIVTEHQQIGHPFVTCEYGSGETTSITLRNLSARQIDELMMLYRNSESPNLYLKHGGPRVWTERRSIQGLWQPSTEGMLKTLKWFHTNRNVKPDIMRGHLRYSATSLKLSRQHLEGHGRWGPPTVIGRGFDRRTFENVCASPFVTEDGKTAQLASGSAE